jgi:hypothetical protein
MLAKELPFRGGHHPIEYRAASLINDREPPKKRVLDKTIITNFLYLPGHIRSSIARNLGTTVEHICHMICNLPSHIQTKAS